MGEQPIKTVNEALTQVEAEKSYVPSHVPDYVSKGYIGEYVEFVERYGKELADYFFQDKIEIKKLAEFYGSKLKKHYPHPMLEITLKNRFDIARLIDTEGSIRVVVCKKKWKNSVYYRLKPIISLSNTSRGLAEQMASLMNMRLSKPIIRKEKRIPIYQMSKTCTPAIDIIYLARPFLKQEENVEHADKAIKLFKERSTLPCGEDGVVISRTEPKYMKAYRLRQEGKGREQIAQELRCKPKTVTSYLYKAKNIERIRERERRRYRERKRKTATKSPAK